MSRISLLAAGSARVSIPIRRTCQIASPPELELLALIRVLLSDGIELDVLQDGGLVTEGVLPVPRLVVVLAISEQRVRVGD